MLENHNRLDKILHSDEYLGMACGADGYVLEEVPGGSVGGKAVKHKMDPTTGRPAIEKKYCGPDCPTLIAEHRGA